MTVTVSVVSTVDANLAELFDKAQRELHDHRGGETLGRELIAAVAVADSETALEALVRHNCVIGLLDDDALRGFAILDPSTQLLVMGIYVHHDYRRHHFGLRLLEFLLANPTPPIDAWALPGDRATKSLYERVGWKARRLTMSGE